MASEVHQAEQLQREGRPDMLTLINELRQRHFFRIAAAYAVGAWLVIQVVDIVGPAFELPGWVLRVVILAAIVGFLGLMAFLLFRPRRDASGRPAIYLSRRARLVAGGGVLAIAIAAAIFSVRSLGREEQVTLAVMPFADLSPKRDKAFLAEGVAEEILSTLGKNADLKVLGRTSSWALRERSGDLEGLRTSLGITHLLEGSVRAAGPDLRLSVRLIRTADGSQEWAEDYRGRGDDVFALQDQVAQAVATRLSSNEDSSAATSRAEMTSADAYNLYLAARQIARTRTEPELKRAYALARKVVEGQPEFAPGHALFSELTWMLSDGENSYGTIPVEKARRIALPHARKAIALAPDAAHGYAALGLVESAGKGIPALQRAMKLDPTRSELPLWLALELHNIDRYKDALSLLERAVAIDPLWPAAVSRLAVDLNGAGHFERAKRVIDDYEARGGEPSQLARMRATQGHMSGDLSAGVLWGERALRLNPAIPYVAGYLQRALALMNVPPPVPLAPKSGTIRTRFYTAGLDAAVAGEPLSAELWDKSDVHYYVYAAGAKRDWPRLAAMYDLRAGAHDEICLRATYMAPAFVLALRATGRAAEAARLLACARAQTGKIQYGGPRRNGAIAQAEVAALAGDSDAALALLDNAMDYGWTGMTARLTNLPALDSLASDPRYPALQRRLDEWIARERHETLALLANRKAA